MFSLNYNPLSGKPDIIISAVFGNVTTLWLAYRVPGSVQERARSLVKLLCFGFVADREGWGWEGEYEPNEFLVGFVPAKPGTSVCHLSSLHHGLRQ